MSETPKTLDLINSYELGYRAFKVAKAKSNFLQAIESSGDKIIQALEADAIEKMLPQEIFLGLKQLGDEQIVEVLPKLSQEQWIRFCDYDFWNEHSLNMNEAKKWLELCYLSGGAKEIYRRYRELDEEYQICFLRGKIKLYDLEEFESLSPLLQDQLYPMPCRQIFIEFVNDDDREFIIKLVEAFNAESLEYAYSLLAHAFYLPPNETELQLEQFRNARIEEDGFVTKQEAQSCFDFSENISFFEEGSEEGLAAIRDTDYLLKTMMHLSKNYPDQYENFKLGYFHLLNNLAIATDIEPSSHKDWQLLIQFADAGVNLGMHYMSGGDVMKNFSQTMITTPKTYFKMSQGIRSWIINQHLWEALRPSVDEKIILNLQKYFQQKKWGLLLDTCDKSLLGAFDFNEVEKIKGLMNRFPLVCENGNAAFFQPMKDLHDVYQSINFLRNLSSCKITTLKSPSKENTQSI